MGCRTKSDTAKPQKSDTAKPHTAKPHVGHLFQGRYRAEMIEDESDYWTVSRYVHLNPVRAGLVRRPEK
jgi:hypothetical protein